MPLNLYELSVGLDEVAIHEQKICLRKITLL